MTCPKIGMSTLFCLGDSFKKMTGHIVNADTTFIEIVDEGLHRLSKRRTRILNDLAASYSIEYTVHAPFADINIASPSKTLLNAMLKKLKCSIVNASVLNCKTWIFHPGLKTGITMFYPGKEWVRNLKSARLLVRFARNHNVTAAIENVPEPFPFIIKSVEDFSRFYNEIDEDVGSVFDIGHANINQQIEEFLTFFGERIIHMHAHDNCGKIDQHLAVGSGNIDWRKTVALIKKASYSGIVVVESVQDVHQSMSRLRRLLS